MTTRRSIQTYSLLWKKGGGIQVSMGILGRVADCGFGRTFRHAAFQLRMSEPGEGNNCCCDPPLEGSLGTFIRLDEEASSLY
jgi:hypothetical protein